ncbi:MAG: hypothetical protein FJ320_10160 [SAR202 cluster bacterium]|nr:hypothetical protein [SAR202 cluster bacterium]
MALLDRMVRAAKMDPNLYEEVEADKSATTQAALVVIITAIALGIGAITDVGWGGLIAGILGGLVAWVIWAWLTYIIGAKIFPESTTEANWGQLARTMGFAHTPRVFGILGIIPVVGIIVGIIVFFWVWACMIVAVRQALDYKSSLRAALVTFLGFAVNIALFIILRAVF